MTASDYDFRKLDEEISSNSKYLIFVDDTGSPGTEYTTLPPDRHTWVAIIIPPQACRQTYNDFAEIWTHAHHSYGCPELHFKEVFQGSGPFEGVSWQRRVTLFEAVVKIFDLRQVRIISQSVETSGMVRRMKDAYGSNLNAIAPVPPFNLNAAEDWAFLILLDRIRAHIASDRGPTPYRARIICDQGWKQAGIVLRLGVFGYCDVFEEDSVIFADSRDVPLIQMADCAAYILNKWQILHGKSRLKGFEVSFLRVVEKLRSSFIGLSRVGMLKDDQTLEVIEVIRSET